MLSLKACFREILARAFGELPVSRLNPHVGLKQGPAFNVTFWITRPRLSSESGANPFQALQDY